MKYIKETNLDRLSIRISVYLLALYYVLTPMEDILSGSAGTVSKYLALLIVMVSLYEKKGELDSFMNYSTILIACMMMLSIISILWSIDRETTINRLISYLLLPGICIYLSSFHLNKEEFKLIENAIILGGIVSAFVLFDVGVYHGTTDRLQINEKNDPNNFAAFMLFPVAIAFKQIKKNKVTSVLICSGLIILFSYALLSTGSRGGLMGLIVLIICCIVFGDVKNKHYIILGILIMMIMIWSIVLPSLPTSIRTRLFQWESYGSGSTRTDLWRDTIFKVVPNMSFFGVGAWCAPYALSEYHGSLSGLHNTYLTVFVEYGIIGAGIFICMLISLVITGIKNHEYIVTSLLLGIAVIAFFLDSYPHKYLWNAIILVLLYTNSKSDNYHENGDIIQNKTRDNAYIKY